MTRFALPAASKLSTPSDIVVKRIYRIEASLNRMLCEEIVRTKGTVGGLELDGTITLGYFFPPPPYSRRFVLAPLRLYSDGNVRAGINSSALNGERSKLVESFY